MSISSLSFSASTRATILRLQTELKDAAAEQGSGRFADVGLTLGRLTGEAVQYHAQESTIKRMQDSNTLVTNRLEMMDKVLTGLRDTAGLVSGNLKTLTSTINNAVAVTAVKETAKSALDSMIGALNINVTGQFLFAGAQTDQTPLENASDVVATEFKAFLAAAGKTAETVSKDDLEKYFSKDGFVAGGKTYRFDDQFADNVDPTKPNWNNWSNGSDTPVVSRISKNETIESSLSTNEAAFRKLAASYSLLNSVGIESMTDEARRAVVSAANSRLDAGVDALTALQTRVGTRINRVELADEGLKTQMTLVKASIERLEGVDTMEAIQRVTALETQLQASYTVTGRLKGLSLMDYL